MPREYIPSQLISVAVAGAEGFPFERFALGMMSHLLGAKFVPAGGIGDGGADGYEGGISEQSGQPTAFLQASVNEEIERKIRGTVARLREVGRDPRLLTFVTSREVRMADRLEATLGDELSIVVRIRDKKYLVAKVNEDIVTQGLYREHIAQYASHLGALGTTALVPVSRHVSSPAVYAFLSQEMDRRGGNESLVDAMADALVLWALEGTDPDLGRFMTREQVIDKILEELPSVDSLLRARIGPRLESLSSKPHRLVRWHTKDDLFCLPFETRQRLDQENASDIVLRDRVLLGFEERSGGAGLVLEGDHKLVAKVSLRALQFTFERQGLEFAAFLRQEDTGDHPDVAEAIRDAILDSSLSGEAASRVGAGAFAVLRQVFYQSSEDERDYLHRLSRTYALLFILKTEPRLIEFFQEMAGDFYLFVGTDQLLKALSEQYLDEADQAARNTLLIARRLGATLSLTEPVLNEVISHLRMSDAEYRNHFVGIDHQLPLEVARNVGPIMLRAYLYALRGAAGSKTPPKSWEAFVQQFCSYPDLQTSAAEEELARYLIALFGMEYVSRDELEDSVPIDDVARLAMLLEPQKARRELAENDALLAHAVFGRRDQQRELSSSNEFGFKTWWLTGETSILRFTKGLVAAKRGARYMMRPDFLLNFIALAPQAMEVRASFANVFPSLLGIKLARRLDPKAFELVLEKVREAEELDDGRKAAAISTIVDKLKSDFSRDYFSSGVSTSTNSIDVVAESQN